MRRPDKQLLRYARAGDVDGVEAALSSGASVDYVDGRGALHIAAAHPHSQMVYLLLAYAADPNVKSTRPEEEGARPLHLAAFLGHTDVMRLLLDGGADAEAMDSRGKRPIHWAALQGEVHALEVLESFGCEVGAGVCGGGNTLHYAAASGSLECVRWLLGRGVPYDCIDKNRWLAKDVAKRNGHTEIHSFLKKLEKPRRKRGAHTTPITAPEPPPNYQERGIDVGAGDETGNPPPSHRPIPLPRLPTPKKHKNWLGVKSKSVGAKSGLRMKVEDLTEMLDEQDRLLHLKDAEISSLQQSIFAVQLEKARLEEQKAVFEGGKVAQMQKAHTRVKLPQVEREEEEKERGREKVREENRGREGEKREEERVKEENRRREREKREEERMREENRGREREKREEERVREGEMREIERVRERDWEHKEREREEEKAREQKERMGEMERVSRENEIVREKNRMRLKEERVREQGKRVREMEREREERIIGQGERVRELEERVIELERELERERRQGERVRDIERGGEEKRVTELEKELEREREKREREQEEQARERKMSEIKLTQALRSLDAEQRLRITEREEKDREISSLTGQLHDARRKLKRYGIRQRTALRRSKEYREEFQMIGVPSGLPHLGISCYINPILQCLYAITVFRDYFTSDAYRKDLRRGRRRGEEDGKVCKSLTAVFKALSSGVEKEIEDKVKLFKAVVDSLDKERPESHPQARIPAHFPTHSSPHQLLVKLLDTLHNELSTRSGRSFISGQFGLGQEHRVTCDLMGQRVREVREEVNTITLSTSPDLPSSLAALLWEEYKEKTVEVECDYCRYTHTCSHHTCLTHLPSVLIIHLHRDWTKEGENELTFPEKYLTLPHHDSPSYQLFGVVGDEGGGEFSAFCRNPHDPTWRQYHDHKVTATSLQRVLALQQPHVLLYHAT